MTFCIWRFFREYDQKYALVFFVFYPKSTPNLGSIIGHWRFTDFLSNSRTVPHVKKQNFSLWLLPVFINKPDSSIKVGHLKLSSNLVKIVEYTLLYDKFSGIWPGHMQYANRREYDQICKIFWPEFWSLGPKTCIYEVLRTYMKALGICICIEIRSLIINNIRYKKQCFQSKEYNLY